MKIMVFGNGSNTGLQDISFPHQSELKVNGIEVKANLRGLKNKPGSTRPADITNALRFKPQSYPNSLEFTYALTTKPYYVGVYLCKTTPVSSLVERIQQHGKRISKASVVSELTKKANDATDVVATSQVVSLKCAPLSYMRLSLPAEESAALTSNASTPPRICSCGSRDLSGSVPSATSRLLLTSSAVDE